MTELAGIKLIAYQIQSSTGFTASNVTIAKWGILNQGKSDHYAIIRPGKTDRTGLTFTVKDNAYQTIIEVWQRYKDDGSSVTELLTHVDNITTTLDQYRKVGDTTRIIRDVNVTGYSEVKEQWNKSGGAAWLSRDIIVDWMEEEAVIYAE